MSLTADDFRNDFRPVPSPSFDGPRVDSTYWGYVISDHGFGRAGQFAGILGRFFGAILLLAAAGLWVLPDATYGAEVFGMKLAAMVMFTVFGGWLVWAGRRATRPEFQVDTGRAELRVGHRSIKGDFRLDHVLAFDAIASVYMLRSKDRSQRARLFLRLDGAHALEVGQGSEAALEALRMKLSRDFARPALGLNVLAAA